MSLPFAFLDQLPIVIAIAGSNGAGKSTFFDTFLSDCGLRFINADVIAEGLEMPAYEAAEVASAIRSSLVSQQESFIFETVLSDPVGDKVDTLAKYADSGYTVVLIFIRVDRVEESIRRVAMRASQGGHDVPDEKLKARFERTKANLQRAIDRLPDVMIYDNSDLDQPYRLVEVYEYGRRVDN
ncbi:zeta toxin family protein [Aporhodopirellula aestuarii]|uniref:Zeta toxin family protein n=1 Tax=Aporhodopirellula aestuarii TaxID=2950107 RepID=A0ABT0UBQ2_9BACT|nr:zeta toxin family protein [Aporhodopirellula aestuarii]MCM2374422.1 zeta toxin family protein [Aporhodopirellula aestuarii]